MEEILKKLDEIRRITLIQTKNVLTQEEAAFMLDLSPRYLYQLTTANKIPYHKGNGGKNYFLKSEIEDWMLRGKVKADYEIEEQAKALCRATARKTTLK